MMQKHPRISLGFIAIVAILAFIGISAFTNVAQAGGQSSLRFDVNPGYPSTGPDTWNGWSHTKELFKATQPTEVTIGHWRRYVSDDPLTTTIGPDSTERTQVGDPSHFLYAHGVYLSYPEGTRNAFVSTQWYSTTEGCDTPRVSVSIKNPRSSSASAKAVIDNNRGLYTLFVTEDEGRTWTDIAIGDFHVTNTGPVGKIWVKTSPTSTVGDYSTYACSITHWNLTKEWIEGATPTPTPSPTATPSPTPTATPAPKPVIFNLANSAISTIEVGSTIDLFIMVNSQEQKTTKAQAFLRYDSRVIRVKPIKGDCPFDKSYEISGWRVDEVKYEVLFVGESSSGTALNCAGLAMQITGLKEGSTTLTFNSASVAYDENNNLIPSDLRNGQITVKTTASSPTPTPSPTATPNPTPMIPVTFSLSPSSSTTEVGKTVDVAVKINSNNQKVGAVQAFIKFDTNLLEVVDMDPKEKGIQPKLGNCSLGIEVVNAPEPTIRYGGVSVPGRVLNCDAMTITFKGKKAGTNVLLFVLADTFASTEDGKTNFPKEVTNGQITVTAPPTPTPAPMKPVVFSLSPSSSTVEVGKTVDVAVQVDTQAQKIGGVQFRLQFDPEIVEVVDTMPQWNGTQTGTGNCGLTPHGVVQGSTIFYADLTPSEMSLRCSLTIVSFKGLKAGQGNLTFQADWTYAIDKDANKLPVDRRDGQIMVWVAAATKK